MFDRYTWHHIATLPTASQATCVSWDPRGDRIVIGGDHLTRWGHKVGMYPPCETLLSMTALILKTVLCRLFWICISVHQVSKLTSSVTKKTTSRKKAAVIAMLCTIKR